MAPVDGTDTPDAVVAVDSMSIAEPLVRTDMAADSTLVAASDSVPSPIGVKRIFNPDPNRALWLSVLCPGLGQIYNRRYWKVPIVVGGYVGLAYAISWNNKMLKDYSRAYNDAMDRYGSDKPDLRIKLLVDDVTALMQGTGFEPFEGSMVKAVVVPSFSQTRKFIDNLMKDVEVQSGGKGYWFKVGDDGSFSGGIAKFLADRSAQLTEALSLKPGACVFLCAGKKTAAQKTAGVMRKMLGNALPEYMDKECYEFCWIVDFPMYEIGEESGELEFCHNPFSMPQGGLKALCEQDPLTINAYQYDLVCNGVELSSGAVRNHDPEIMIKAFELVGLGEADVKAKFPAMYNAFCYGAPPHAGIAPGVDRMVMLIAGEDSIREVIPFPMNKNAQDLMMGAPSFVEPKQLTDVHIAILEKEKD